VRKALYALFIIISKTKGNFYLFIKNRIVDEQLKKDYDSKIKAKLQQTFKFNYQQTPKMTNVPLKEVFINSNQNTSDINIQVSSKKRFSGANIMNSTQLVLPITQKKHDSILSVGDNQSIKSFNIGIEK
jgi:capsular polysaccharide biosynthesis protein